MESTHETPNVLQAIDLTPFCDPEAVRYAIGDPWTKDGKRYATDGRVAVRLLVPESADELPEGRTPNIDEILKPVDGDWQPWPEVEPCSMCFATLRVECPSCGGDGECTHCKCGQPHECGKCKDGNVFCPECAKKGSFESHLFGQAELSRRYAFIISKLLNVEYLPALPNDNVRFRFTGGEGVVASLRD